MKRLLVVDDELITLANLSELLEERGYTIVGKASSGPAAVQAATQLKPDLVLMDINMPGDFDGIEAGRRIETDLDIPVVFVTAYSSDPILEQINQLGAFGYITKPYEETQLETAIRIALFRSRTERKLKQTLALYRQEINSRVFLHRIVSQINLELDPLAKPSQLADLIRDSTGLDGLSLYEYHEKYGTGLLKQVLASDNRENTMPALVPINPTDAGQIKLFQKSCLFRGKDALTGNPTLSWITKASVTSAVTYPLYNEEKFYGIIIYYYRSRRAFGKSFREYLKIVTSALSIGIKRQDDLVKLRGLEENRRIQEIMLERAGRLSSLGQLTAAIAHEIRQPLQSIKLITDSAIYWKEQNKSPSIDELFSSFEKISARVDRIEGIIQNLSRLLKTPDKVEVKVVNVNAVIQDILSFYEQKLKSHQIILETQLAPDLKNVSFSETQLHQVIVNIITNAVNAIDTAPVKTKKIRISTRNLNQTVEISIEDSGPGIAPEIEAKIFDPFFSTYKGKESVGMGLGLYLVNNILKNFNSTIKLRKTDLGGACFDISIPA